MRAVYDLDELDVDALGKQRFVAAEQFAHARNVIRNEVGNEYDAVRIAHRNAVYLYLAARRVYLALYYRAVLVRFERNGNFLGLEHRRAHIDLDRIDFAVAREQAELAHARKRVYGNIELVGLAVVVKILTDTADAVAAHLAFRAVGIEHTHFRVAGVRRIDEYHAVAAYAEMPVGEVDRYRLHICYRVRQTVDVDIVVAAALHLDKVEPLALGAHIVDIDELGIYRTVTAFERIRQRVSRVYRGKARDIQHDSAPTELNVVERRYPAARRRGDEVIDLARIEQSHSRFVFAVRFVYLVDDGHLHARFGDDTRRALGRVKLEPELIVILRDVDYLGLVGIADGKQYAARAFHLVARRAQALVQRFFERLAYAEHLARRLHFRSEMRIEVGELLEREYRHLDCYIRRGAVQSRTVAELFQFFADHALRSELYHRHARDLGNVRYRARRARIDLDNIDLAAADYVLYIDEPLGIERERELARVFD